MVESAALKSSIPYTSDSHFPLENIPFGVYESPEGPHVCTRIGDSIIDLAKLESQGVFKGPLAGKTDIFNQSSLNAFIALGKDAWHEARVTIQRLFTLGYAGRVDFVWPNASDVNMRLPIKIGDYTDFYSSRNHAYNVGVMVRGPDNAL